MKYLVSILLVFTAFNSKAQTQQDTIKLTEQDSAIFYSIDLNEIKILQKWGIPDTFGES